MESRNYGKFCINCKHHVQIGPDTKGHSGHACAHPDMADPVTGIAGDCVEARRSLCREAALFDPAADLSEVFGDGL